MSIGQALYETLGQFAGLSALVGTRIFPDEAPQGASRPYVVWGEVSLVQASDLNGSAESGGLNNYRIDVTCYAVKAIDAREVDHQVRLAMEAATQFKSLLMDARSLEFEADTKLFSMQSDFSVWLKT